MSKNQEWITRGALVFCALGLIGAVITGNWPAAIWAIAAFLGWFGVYESDKNFWELHKMFREHLAEQDRRSYGTRKIL